MSKRFTETSKWSDPWFRALNPTRKALYQWMLDNCDCGGVLPEIDWALASFQIGAPVSEADLIAFDGRIEPCGKGYWLTKFVAFQVGYIDPERPSMPQRGVIKALDRAGISLGKAIERVSKPFPKGYQTLKDKDKDKDKDKEGEVQERESPKPRPRDLIFETVCEVVGIDARALTKPGRGALNVALRDIRAASPDVTPQEVKRRAERYARKFSGAALTAPALAKHWASLGAAPVDDWTKQAVANLNRAEPPPEPQFDNSFAESLLVGVPGIKEKFGIK